MIHPFSRGNRKSHYLVRKSPCIIRPFHDGYKRNACARNHAGLLVVCLLPYFSLRATGKLGDQLLVHTRQRTK
jgi:hypothetical protein